MNISKALSGSLRKPPTSLPPPPPNCMNIGGIGDCAVQEARTTANATLVECTDTVINDLEHWVNTLTNYLEPYLNPPFPQTPGEKEQSQCLPPALERTANQIRAIKLQADRLHDICERLAI